MSTDYDYTKQDSGTGEAFDPNSYIVGGVAPTQGADDIERERARREPPAGDHEFIVTGFLKAPELKNRNGYYNGQAYNYNVPTVGVRLSLAKDPGASIIDFFDIPPDAADQTAAAMYLYGSKNADGKNAGFMASKFLHFIDRLGFPVVKGQALPAIPLGAWIGRRIVATIELQTQKDQQTGQPKVNPTTGEPYPPRAQVKLFSYRPAQATIAGPVMGQPSPQPAPAPQPKPQPAPAPMPAPQPPPMPAPQPQPMPAPAAPPVPNGASRLAGVL
jgi:hypothetical protein